MQFMEGVKVTDVQKLKKLGISEKDVAELLIKVFSQQIFRFGFVHAE